MNDMISVRVTFDELNVLVGYRIRRALVEGGRSQGDLASAMGVSRSAVKKWLTGSSAVSTANLVRIGRWLGVSHQGFVPLLGEVDSTAYQPIASV